MGFLPAKGIAQAAQGAVHAPNENMLPRQCVTLGATVVFPCLCTTVEVVVVRQGAGEGAVLVRPTGDRQAPPSKFRVSSDFAGSGFERKKKYFYRGNEVKSFF